MEHFSENKESLDARRAALIRRIENIPEEHLAPWEEFARREREFREHKTKHESVSYDDLEIGQEARESVVVTDELIEFVTITTGDANRVHTDKEYARTTKFGGIILHGAHTIDIISKLLGTKLPGTGTIWLGIQNFEWKQPVRPGVTLEVFVRVAEKMEKGRVLFDIGARVGGEIVAEGKTIVIAPRKKI